MAPRWFYTSRDEERRGLARADVVLAITAEDARTFAEMLPTTRVLTVPYGEPVHPALPEAALPNRLLCVASDNDLNVDGFRWLFAEVWPLVRAARPAELVVCGGVCDKLGTVPEGVVLRGFVPDLEAEYARARLVLSPLRGGTGMKVKVVAALCRGRPVVATRAGATGVQTDGTPSLTIRDDGRGFAEAVLDLLTDETRWRRAVASAGAEARRLLAPEMALAPLAICLENEGHAKSGLT
jgi:succinoglycan biosynthesis protein ExoO